MARAKKGKIKTLPKTLSDIKTTNLSDLTASTQRRLLMSLNREANARLKSIVDEINANKLKPTILQENQEYFRIIQGKKGYQIGSGKKFTLQKNATKDLMEQMIKDRVKFLGSKMTVTKDTQERGVLLPEVKKEAPKNIEEVYGIQKAELLDVFNTTFNKNRKSLTDAQYERFGALLDKARKNHLLDERKDYKLYLQDLARVSSLREVKEYSYTVDKILDMLEDAMDEKLGLKTKKATNRKKRLKNRAQKGVTAL